MSRIGPCDWDDQRDKRLGCRRARLKRLLIDISWCSIAVAATVALALVVTWIALKGE